MEIQASNKLAMNMAHGWLPKWCLEIDIDIGFNIFFDDFQKLTLGTNVSTSVGLMFTLKSPKVQLLMNKKPTNLYDSRRPCRGVVYVGDVNCFAVGLAAVVVAARL
jgi:hypothetical protein